MFPLKVWIPTIPNTRMKKAMKANEFPKSGIDLSIIVTSLLILGIYLTVFKGRKTLNARRTFKLGT